MPVQIPKREINYIFYTINNRGMCLHYYRLLLSLYKYKMQVQKWNWDELACTGTICRVILTWAGNAWQWQWRGCHAGASHRTRSAGCNCTLPSPELPLHAAHLKTGMGCGLTWPGCPSSCSCTVSALWEQASHSPKPTTKADLPFSMMKAARELPQLWYSGCWVVRRLNTSSSVCESFW